MKKICSAALLFLFAAAVILYSCKKTLTKVADYRLADSSVAYLKVIDASVNFRTIMSAQTNTSVPDSFNVYQNANRLTSGTTPPAPSLTFGTIFPGISSASNGYLSVSPGTSSFRLSVGGTANADSVTVFTLTKYLQPGKYYTLMVTDSLLSARDSNRIFVQDAYTTPVAGYINLRFINAVINDTVGKTVDLWSYARNAALISKVKPDSVSSFQVLGINPGVADTFYVRRTGTTQNLAKLAYLPTAQRTYTFFYYGDANLSTGKKAKALAVYNH